VVNCKNCGKKLVMLCKHKEFCNLDCKATYHNKKHSTISVSNYTKRKLDSLKVAGLSRIAVLRGKGRTHDKVIKDLLRFYYKEMND
jgi:hypothetical protein